MTRYIGAIDQGTTSTRFMIFDHAGGVVGIHQLEHRQIYPQPGWVEHDALEMWARTRAVIDGALAKTGLAPADLAAIGMTNQRETDGRLEPETGQPYGNAIVWQDTRTDKLCNDLALEGGQDRFRAQTGLPLATYFSGPKLRWILDNVPGVRAAAGRGEAIFGNMDTWVIWNLTGGPNGGAHVTDVTNASRTLLMNLHTLDWDEGILAELGIPRQMLPTIRPSSDPEIYGYALGKVPVCGDLGDQQAALVGQTCFGVGEAKNTYGTGCFMLLNTGTLAVPSKHGLLTTVAYKMGGAPALRAGRLDRDRRRAGAVAARQPGPLRLLQARRRLRPASARQRRHLHRARFFRSVRALRQSDARGVIVGLTRFINRNHLCRAASKPPHTRPARCWMP